jgi:hypothetical protein
MKTNNSQNKVKIVVQKENKKPPKVDKSHENENEITEKTEELYLKGEPHIDITTSNNEDILPSLNENLKTEPKVEKVFRPRENYLKEKISKLNFDEKLINNIQKDLGSQIESLKSEIRNNKVKITEVPKDLNKYIIRSSSTDNNIKYSNEDYELKKKHKIIKELKEEEILLKQNLMKIEENEALLNNEGYMNLNDNSECITPFDKSKKEQRIKEIKKKKNDINERIKEIEFRINQLLEEDKNKLTKKEKLQNFKENFERDKEIIEERAKKYLKETKERNQRLANDINQLVERRKKEIEEKEKKDELKKDKIRQKFMEKEKALEQKRLKEKTEIMLRYKPYINQKNDKTENDYLFGIYDKRYKENEQKLIDKVNNDRKNKNKTVTSAELQDFWTKIDEKKEEIKKKKEIKEKKEMEKFEMAKSFKPSFIGHFSEMIDEEFTKFREKEQNRKEEIMGNKLLKENFGKKLLKRHYIINEHLKQERLNKILVLENPKLVQIKDTFHKKLQNSRKKRVLIKKRDPNKPSKYPWLEKSLKEMKNMNNSAIIEKHLIKRPKSLRYSASFTEGNQNDEEIKDNEENKDNKDKIKKKIVLDPKQIDYLKILREEKKEKEEKKKKEKEEKEKGIINETDKENEKNKNIKKKKKKILNKKVEEEDIIYNINNAKQNAQQLEQKAEMEEKYMNLNGGIEKNPEMGKKVSDLLIGSIKAKLNIMNNIYKQ